MPATGRLRDFLPQSTNSHGNFIRKCSTRTTKYQEYQRRWKKTDATTHAQPASFAVRDTRSHSFLRDGYCAEVWRCSRFAVWAGPRSAARAHGQEPGKFQ